MPDDRANDGHFYAKGREIFKSPVSRREGDVTHTTMGFNVCTASDWVDPEDIAKMLNVAEFGSEAGPSDA